MTSIRRILWLAALVLLPAITNGCIVRGAADTVLEIKRDVPNAMPIDSDQIVFGLKTVLWRGGEHSYEVVGHGAHPREHETYMFFASEGYPLLVDRFIYITPDGPPEEWPDYRIAFAARTILFADDESDPWTMLLFTGTLPPPRKTLFNRLKFTLIQVPMVSASGPIRTIYVSGTIIATPADDEDFDQLVESYQRALREE